MKKERHMRQLCVYLLFVLGLLMLPSCGEEKLPEPAAGVYEVDYELKYHNYDLWFTPWLRLEPEEKKFVFMYGRDPVPLSYPWGYYTVEGNTITASTWQAGLVFSFEILDEHTLRFTGANVDMTDKYRAQFTDAAQIGDIFYWAEELPE